LYVPLEQRKEADAIVKSFAEEKAAEGATSGGEK
jgi:hypothetical protein